MVGGSDSDNDDCESDSGDSNSTKPSYGPYGKNPNPEKKDGKSKDNIDTWSLDHILDNLDNSDGEYAYSMDTLDAKNYKILKIIDDKESWKERIDYMNGIHNDEKSGSIKWRENAKNIEMSMGLLSDKAKETIIKYYEKYG
jgi:hypothetical protein